jgi:hypothetical protein
VESGPKQDCRKPGFPLLDKPCRRYEHNSVNKSRDGGKKADHETGCAKSNSIHPEKRVNKAECHVAYHTLESAVCEVMLDISIDSWLKKAL